jgi:hypothetical protein
MVADGRAERALLILPEAGKLSAELSDADRSYRLAEIERTQSMHEFFPMMATRDFPAAEQRRMVTMLTAHLEPLLAPADLELVRQVQADLLQFAMRRGAEMADAIDGEGYQEPPPSVPWVEAAADLGDRITVLTGPGLHSAGPVLAQYIPGVRVVELDVRSDFPWLEDPAAVLAAVRTALPI